MVRVVKEDNIILNNYHKIKISDIQILIPNKSLSWIRQRAFRLGISNKLKPRRVINIGEKIGKLTTLNRISIPSKYGTKIKFKCLCECGIECVVQATHLRTGHTTSCGCQQRLLDKIKHRKEAGYSIITQLIQSYKYGAKTRNLSWEINRDEFINLINGKCDYCGRPPTNIRELKGNILSWNGIDRINNKLGYTIKNSIPCCTFCNRAKNNKSKEEFLNMIQKIYNYSIKNKDISS